MKKFLLFWVTIFILVLVPISYDFSNVWGGQIGSGNNGGSELGIFGGVGVSVVFGGSTTRIHLINTDINNPYAVQILTENSDGSIELLSGSSKMTRDAEGNVKREGDGFFGGVANEIVKVVVNAILTVLGFFLWLSGLMLNLIIDVTINNVSNIIKNDQINKLWQLFRNIVAISFIFAILYIAIKTILGLLDGQTKTLLKNIIIAALLINFSYFFVTVGIDISNILSLKLHDISKSCYSNSQSSSKGDQKAEVGISNCIMSNLGLPSLWSISNAQTGAGEALSKAFLGKDGGFLQTVVKSFFAIVLILLAIFVILFMAIILIFRLVILIILLISSPIMFLGMIWPGLKQVSDGWRKSFFEQIFIAPVMFLMFFLALKVLVAVNKILMNDKGVKFGDLSSGDSSVTMSMIFYIIAIMMFGVVIFVSKKVAGGVSGFAIKGAGAIGIGGLALGARRAVGAGSALANSKVGKRFGLDKESMQERAKNGGMFSKSFAKIALSTGDKLKNSTFDLRNAPGVSSALKASGVSLGDATKKTFESEVKAKQEKIAKKEKLYGAEKKNPDHEDFREGGVAFNEELGKEENKELNTKYTQAKREIESYEEKIKENEKNLEVSQEKLRDAVRRGHTNDIEKAKNEISMYRIYIEESKEEINKRTKTIKEIATIIQANLSSQSSTYLNEKAKSWSPVTAEAARRAIKHKETDMDKLTKKIREQIEADEKKKKDEGS